MGFFPRGSLVSREEELTANPQALAAAIGDCAGEVGQHGKWMDTMIPFIRKCVPKISKTGAGAGRGDAKGCFALSFGTVWSGDRNISPFVPCGRLLSYKAGTERAGCYRYIHLQHVG